MYHTGKHAYPKKPPIAVLEFEARIEEMRPRLLVGRRARTGLLDAVSGCISRLRNQVTWRHSVMCLIEVVESS
jgi:hypothetical protein